MSTTKGPISWQRDLGSPKVPCEISVPNIGLVIVTQTDIDQAEQLGGDLLVELAESISDSGIKCCELGEFLPA